jgi:hypothetical protein
MTEIELARPYLIDLAGLVGVPIERTIVATGVQRE